MSTPFFRFYGFFIPAPPIVSAPRIRPFGLPFISTRCTSSVHPLFSPCPSVEGIRCLPRSPYLQSPSFAPALDSPLSTLQPRRSVNIHGGNTRDFLHPYWERIKAHGLPVENSMHFFLFCRFRRMNEVVSRSRKFMLHSLSAVRLF